MKKGFRSPLAMVLIFSLVLSLCSGVFTVSAATNSAVLVTDASALRAGDQIVIVALDYDYALGTTQNSNNRNRTAITKSGKTVYYTSDAQVITLEQGTASGSFAFRVGDGQYLYAASSTANYLRTMGSIDANGSWAISIDGSTGAATITACGASSRNHIRYNSDFSLFSCYGSVTTTKQVSIYKIGSSTSSASDYYLFGYINGANYGCEEDAANLGKYKFVDGKLTVTLDSDSYVGVKTAHDNWYMTNGWQGQVTSVTLYNTKTAFTADKLFVPGGVSVTFTLVCNSNDTLTLSYSTGTCAHTYNKGTVTTAATCSKEGVKTFTCSKCGHSYTEAIAVTAHNYSSKVTTAPTCSKEGVKTFTCSGCGKSYTETIAKTSHSYSGGKCTACGATDSSYVPSAYYLFGYINGADYACEGDAANMGQYKFVDGKLTATFDSDSYVAVKAEGNAVWYMTNGWQENATSVILYDTTTPGITADKLRVPGGVKITFTLVRNNDGTLTLSYVQDGCSHSYSSKVTTEATCTKAGVKTYTCTKCGDSYTQSITATGHTYSSKITTAASCTAAGTKTFTCTKCSHSYKETIAATGHKYANGKCSVCGKADPNCTHSYTNAVTKAANCTTAGVRTYTCSKCGHSYTQSIPPSGHTYSSKVTTTATCTKEGVKTYTCIKCGASYTEKIAAAGHTFSNGKCTVCGVSDPNCSHTYTSKITTIASCTKDGVKTFTCSKCAHSYTEPIAATGHNHISKVVTSATCTTVGVKSFTCSKCGDTYKEDIPALGHTYTTAVTKPTCTLGGYTTYTCSVCKYVYKGDIVSATGHGYYNGVCTGCGQAEPSYGKEYYLCGRINGKDYACDSDAANTGTYKFVNGKLSVAFETDSYVGVKLAGNEAWFMTDGDLGNVTSATLYNTNTDITPEKLYIPGGISVTFTLKENSDGTLTLSYTVDGCTHNYVSTGTTAASCMIPGVKTFACTICKGSYEEVVPPTGHSYHAGQCILCGAADPTWVRPDYYLFGYINGVNCGFEGGIEDLGKYKFVDDTLTVTFDCDSYVGVRTSDNWYMTDGYLGDVHSGILYNNNTDIIGELMFIPGGTSVMLTINDNGDDTVTLSYSAAPFPVTQPSIKLRYPTLSFKDEILLNIYFEASNLQDVVDIGLITYGSEVPSWNINNAENVVPGYRFSSQKELYVVTTEGIPAKNMADDLWFAIYAELSNGTYYYTKLVNYSATTYAYSLLGSGDAQLDALLVSMLNYGAAAQVYFQHNTDNLANKDLTEAQQTIVEEYRSDMLTEVPAPSTEKQGVFANNGGYSKRYPSVSFKGAFSINYYYAPTYAPVDGITMYYWDQATYNSASILTPGNATGVVKMEGTGTGEYKAAVTGIAAKNIDDGVYVAFLYSDGTTTYASGVLPYSIGTYCQTQAVYSTPFTPFAKATAVYGYYAKQYFS